MELEKRSDQLQSTRDKNIFRNLIYWRCFCILRFK